MADDDRLTVNLNFLGLPVESDYVDRLLDGSDHSQEHEYRIMLHVLEIPPHHLPRDVLDRYVRVSSQALYIPILPVTDKIFERLLLPLRSAKRCFSLGEYLAAIELCSHVGEMLANLLWLVTPIKLNGQPINANTEKLLFGRSFEKQGQKQRVNILRGFNVVQDEDFRRFNELRDTRTRYFHLWSGGTTKAEQDAFRSFENVIVLVKTILQIKYDSGKVSISPLLHQYLRKHRIVRTE